MLAVVPESRKLRKTIAQDKAPEAGYKQPCNRKP
jgi:hypothetical protein